MTSMHVSLTGTAARGVTMTDTPGGNRSELEALQKKMTGLLKDLKEAAQDQSPGAKERLKLLQLAIQACQMQIEQLMNAAAQKAAKKAAEAAQEQAGKQAGRRTGANEATGSYIDTHA